MVKKEVKLPQLKRTAISRMEDPLEKPYLIKVGSKQANGMADPARKPRTSLGQWVFSLHLRTIKTARIKGPKSTQEEWNCISQKRPKPIMAKARPGEIHLRES